MLIIQYMLFSPTVETANFKTFSAGLTKSRLFKEHFLIFELSIVPTVTVSN